MANVRYTIDGYGQVELNNCAFRRDGRIEAQSALDSTDFASAVAENGMLLAVDRVARTICFPDASDKRPIGLNYTAEHMYDERLPGLKNFYLNRDSFYPRIGLLAVGDKFTTNCLCYNSSTYANDSAFCSALASYKTTRLYGGQDATCGAIAVASAAPANGPVLSVVEYTTMPDGQAGVMFQVLSV